MKAQRELVALTPSQLTEVCVQFAAEMGWIGRPGGTDWYVRLKCHGDAEAFHTSLAAAMHLAVHKAAGENNTEVDSLRQFKHTWESVNG
jgi:hypothetical protein